VNKGFHFIKTF